MFIQYIYVYIYICIYIYMYIYMYLYVHGSQSGYAVVCLWEIPHKTIMRYLDNESEIKLNKKLN